MGLSTQIKHKAGSRTWKISERNMYERTRTLTKEWKNLRTASARWIAFDAVPPPSPFFFFFHPPRLVQGCRSAETILNSLLSPMALPSIRLDFKNLLLSSRNSIGTIPQELLIIKSLISPDSAESILLSYLISIRIMPPVSRAFQFRGQGVGLISKLFSC